MYPWEYQAAVASMDGMGQESIPYASSMATFAIETEQVRPAIGQLAEVADRFIALAREQISDGMVAAAGWPWAQRAVELLRSELDEHEARVASGFAHDVEALALTVNRYVQTDSAAASTARQLGSRTPLGTR